MGGGVFDVLCHESKKAAKHNIESIDELGRK